MTFVLVALLFGTAPQVPLSVATTDDALAVMGNPAGLGLGRRSDFYYLYNFRRTNPWYNSAFCANLGPLGTCWEPGSRYGVALGFGEDGYYGGVRLVRDSLTRWDFGAMARPVKWLSLGAVWSDANHGWGSVTGGIGLRPVGNRLTVSADVLASRLLHPVIGIEAEPLDGLALAGKLKPDDMSFCFGLTLGLGKASVGGVGSIVGDMQQAGAFVRLGQETRRSLVPAPKQYVEVRLSGSVADQKPGFSLTGERPSRTTWELLDLLSRAAKDKSVAGIVLKFEGFSMGFAQAQEFRAALEQFRAKGKKVFIYASDLGMTGLYIASVADRVVCYPLCEVSIPGMTAGALFLKGTLEKLGLEFDGTRHGKYKSAVEMFTEDSLTEPNREQLSALLDASFREFLSRTSAGRGMSKDSMEKLVNQGFFLADEAKAAGLIDTTCYPDELDDLLKKVVPGFKKTAEGSYRGIVAYDYDWQGPGLVAVVYATGSIAAGESRTDLLTGEMTMGASTITRALQQARKNPDVKAIVLRVDSPGGDGFASDLIWREVELCRNKKPVVVSMGNVAASGGYYISCNADRVYASPSTITGSIGVFSFKFVTEGLYEKLGARRQVLKRGEHADAASDLRAYTPEEESLILHQVDDFYHQFVEKVAHGRKMSYGAVDSLGQGRVWAGSDAQANGLVDSLGGLLAAVGWAKQQAKLKDCGFVFYPAPRSGIAGAVQRVFAEQILEGRLWQ